VLSRVRAALILTVVWVLCWIPFAVALDHVLADILLPGPRLDSPYTPVRLWAIWGALSGLGFAIVLGFAERGRSVSSLSIPRVLSWGAIGSALVPVLYFVYWFLTTGRRDPGVRSLGWRIALIEVGISAFLGIVCALCTLALMRAGKAGDQTHSAGAA